MSLFLILLAAGESKRLKSNTPKPYQIVNNKALIEYSLNAFKEFKEIKKTIVVYNTKHKKCLDVWKWWLVNVWNVQKCWKVLEVCKNLN